MNTKLHIVCFDVPYPVSHGGYFDLFYKLKALKELGIGIHLHCFEYGRGEQKELEKYCIAVKYYPRKKLSGISFRLPYIVSTRINEELVKDLSMDNDPILLEGTHTTHLLYEKLFPGRKIIYRLHNIEQIYYRHLYRTEKGFFKKLYFLLEARSLQRYESELAKRKVSTLAVSEKDVNTYITLYPGANISYLPLFLPYKKLNSSPGNSDYMLYHGNLSVAENEEAALYLLKAFQSGGIRMVIAGRNPSSRLTAAVSKTKNGLIKNPTDEQMEELIRDAHVNIIYSFNNTGIKIKLLHALYAGRHCIVNEAAIPGNDFRRYVHVCDSPASLRDTAMNLMQTPFTKEEVDQREHFLLAHFDNRENAQKLSAFLR